MIADFEPLDVFFELAKPIQTVNTRWEVVQSFENIISGNGDMDRLAV